ncbi:hypothetical protein DL96DRAFT_629094 [Flagelloscypha sp. PMI_526]|nr:hypothetical protein DL96DRAFT_629094 [Flagelloscypha sp. PMI_526]
MGIMIKRNMKCDVDFLDGSWFFKVLSEDPELIDREYWWDWIEDHDLLVGGLDYSIDYSKYTSLAELDSIQSGLARLHLRIWPPPAQLEILSNKISLLRRLDGISPSGIRPRTYPLIEDMPIPNNKVIKRTHSECGVDVHMPGHGLSWGAGMPTPFGSRWFAQDYVQFLKNWGEYRSIIIEGKVLYTVHTSKFGDGDDDSEAWSGCLVDTWPTLKELSALPATNPFPFNPKPSQESGNGKEEYLSFVESSWRALCDSESKAIGGRSSIGQFCRFDVGLNRKPDGNMGYFVNEVERTLATSLWSMLKGVPLDELSKRFYDGVLCTNI